MQAFISISRNFSVKIHGHLKILVHLVNNLVESEDNVELIDTILKMPNLKSEYKNLQNTTIKTELNERTTEDDREPGLDKFYEIIKNENQKIQDKIQ